MNPWIIVGFLVALIAVGAGGYLKGEHDGKTAEKAEWQGRENTELTAANAKIFALEEGARKLEREHAQRLADISAKFEKDKANAAAQKERDIAAARAGALSLRIPSPCKDPGGSDGGAAPASPGERDGAKTTELPRAVTEFLLGFADDADEVVDQLTACQAVISSDRASRRD